MMIRYPGLEKLKTTQVVFQNAASDSGTLEQLNELSSKRKAIVDSICENNYITEAIAREMSGGLTSRCQQDIQKLEHYLPLLENLVTKGMNHRMKAWISELKIRWSSVLTSSSIFHLRGPKLYQCNDLNFELGMVLFLYGAMLRVRALEVLSSDLVESAKLFRKAAGVYSYLAEEVLPCLNLVKDRPPEAFPCLSAVLSLICLADAQAVAAKKAEESGNTKGLLAKLHSGITQFLTEAIDVLQVAMREEKNISSRLMDFTVCCKTLHDLKSCKYLGQVLKDEGKIGAAVGVLRRALGNAKKNMPRDESWRSVLKEFIDEVTVLLRKYERENDFVSHEKVPSENELPLPDTIKIARLIPYQPQNYDKPLVFKL